MKKAKTAKKRVKKTAPKAAPTTKAKSVYQFKANMPPAKNATPTVDTKLDSILENEKLILEEEKGIRNEENQIEKEETRIEREEKEEQDEEHKVEALERGQLSELEKLQKLEQQVEDQVKEHPLKKVTLTDLFRGIIGALIGTLFHYTFIYGVEISENLSMQKATALFVISFIIGIMLLYATGFKKVDKKTLVYLPIRVTILYAVSIIVSVSVLWFFYPAFGQTFEGAYKQTATVLVSAVFMACTADIIGK